MKTYNSIVFITAVLLAGIFPLGLFEDLISGIWGARDAFAQHQGHGAPAPAKPAPPAPAPTQPKQPVPEEEPPTVEIPIEKQQLIGVKTAMVSMQTLRSSIRTVGRVEADEKKLAAITMHFDAWIEKLYVDYVGKYVQKGDPLAEVNSHELYATQQEFLNALKWSKQSNGANDQAKDQQVSSLLVRDSEAIVEAAKQRLRLWEISDEQIDAIAQSGKPNRMLTLYSPVNGYVIQKNAVQGMQAKTGDKLFDIADLSTVWIIADVYEYELPSIRPGETAKISMSYFPGREFIATVDYVYPMLSGETRTAKVRFSVPNPGSQLKPQMFTNVEIKVNKGRKLVVPADAVIDTGTRQIVYVDKGDGYFEPRDVVVGARTDGMIEIRKGLKVKEKVATSATFLIDSEARLKGIVK